MVDPVLIATLAGLVATLIAIAYSVVPEIAGRYEKVLVLGASAVIFGAAAASNMISGTVLQVVATYLTLAAGALGARVATATALPMTTKLYQIRKPPEP